MAYVKLDTTVLDSTLWVDRECREVFLTALLLAEPFEAQEPIPQIAVRSLDRTGFEVPPGWYGFVHAAGSGILRRALVETDVGMDALERLGAPDLESRTPDFEGRRLVRVDGGFIVLNFMRFRDRDHTSATRSKRYRDRLKSRATNLEQGTDTRVVTSRSRSVTQAVGSKQEAEAKAEAEKQLLSTNNTELSDIPLEHQPAVERYLRSARMPGAYLASLRAIASGQTHPRYPWSAIGQALGEMAAAGESFNVARLRGYCRKLTEPTGPVSVEDEFARAIAKAKREEAHAG